MHALIKGVVRSYRRVAAQFLAPLSCPICLEPLPVIGLREAAEDSTETHVKLLCRHKFCTACIGAYVEMKVKAREVEEDQLVCPVVECKACLKEGDIAYIGGMTTLRSYRKTLKRVRDEKNPSARWCPRPECGELILCESTENFTCPKCQAVGCFNCRGYAHRFWFCRGTEDKSYLDWEKSVGEGRAVRACPQCQMRIWKSEGCNHMTCTHCRHEYCWVCETKWDPSHYSCYEVTFLGTSYFARLLPRVFGYSTIVFIVLVVSIYGFALFAGGYVLFCVALNTVQRHIHGHRRPLQLNLDPVDAHPHVR
ncbi:hypothetical protein Poli38472_013544 [Pythium oligandrum]|uniref:RBR-type E3 ubiquitin transferase n=1 Tax=Pythium oligandrum TaxID=41045 RepID=A0A8K1C875_PYTOL|nr:hypothetical protein Poli38472_013544 [Pythium oligandrum]|eukprot:TMW58070.1 hypothetical protein Poli38472_013544 [Pythium oligandrum]